MECESECNANIINQKIKETGEVACKSDLKFTLKNLPSCNFQELFLYNRRVHEQLLWVSAVSAWQALQQGSRLI